MFENPDFQVDEQSEDYRLLNPIVSKVEQKRKKKLRQMAEQAAQVHRHHCFPPISPASPREVDAPNTREPYDLKDRRRQRDRRGGSHFRGTFQCIPFVGGSSCKGLR